MGPSIESGREVPGRDAIDRQIRSWLGEGSTRLTRDAGRPFDVEPDRFRGRFLLLGVAAVAGRDVDERALPAAASVEVLYGQALLNARATGLLETDFPRIDRTRALLASDYLHALAYAGLRHLDVEPPVGHACFRSLSAASERLAACWTRVDEDGSSSFDRVPIEPIVTAAAGDLAGVLARADGDCRRALRATGAALGVARWQGGPGTDADALADVLPDDWPDPALPAVDPDSVDELLEPVADSASLSRLRRLADSVLRQQREGLTND